MELISHAMCMWLTMQGEQGETGSTAREEEKIAGCEPYCWIYNITIEVMIIALFKKIFMIIILITLYAV